MYDILCLQEVLSKQYLTAFLPEYDSLKYSVPSWWKYFNLDCTYEGAWESFTTYGKSV
jgi:endonuclease/exonuclease/phosphatase family metal-dependent hydrolase